ncbi:hypothetical protein TEA_006720 [Camellia sinensis var. sinensis]|uniref:Serine aminopeptidase S33 domain-containing protein n=1 Tax=Camellia sinensis var. sinensis TaxID=542762 RepID=A0A4S4D7V2_CAMSN|nr:hypothetical protein TEA_006720 [Camellia sinensis var. sinensis]
MCIPQIIRLVNNGNVLFTLLGFKVHEFTPKLRNQRGHTLQCSHYVPSPFPEDTPLPCVIYCHGNSGCRADANEAAVILLPSNITVFTLDFSGSGLSDGDYVSLGWHEKDDLKVVVSYLRSNEQISCIGLWGRSMGAVTSLLYGAEDPSIAGMVLDSAFSNLFDLMMELVDVYKIRLPKFTVWMTVTRNLIEVATIYRIQANRGWERADQPKHDGKCCNCNQKGYIRVFNGGLSLHTVVLNDLHVGLQWVYESGSKVKVAVQYMRRVIQKKANFDIMDLNCIQVAPKTFIPALFGHANDDKFIQPHHSDRIFKSYVGDKNIIKFDGDHNSSRPQFYYDSVSIFFHNILHPPRVSSVHATLRICAYTSQVEPMSSDCNWSNDVVPILLARGWEFELHLCTAYTSLLYEIIAGLRTVGTDVASSSSAPPGISTTKSVSELLTDVAPVASVIDSMINEANALVGDDPSEMQDKQIGQNDECCSYTSSNRESWGRCSSLGSDDEQSSDNNHETTVKVLATPLRKVPLKPSDLSQEENGILPWLLESIVGGSSTEKRLAGARVFSSKRDSEIWVDSWVVRHLLLGQKTTESSLLFSYIFFKYSSYCSWSASQSTVSQQR